MDIVRSIPATPIVLFYLIFVAALLLFHRRRRNRLAARLSPAVATPTEAELRIGLPIIPIIIAAMAPIVAIAIMLLLR